MGRGVPRGLHPVVGGVDLLPHHQDGPHGHLPFGKGPPGLLQGPPHEALGPGGGKSPKTSSTLFPSPRTGQRGLSSLGTPFSARKATRRFRPKGRAR